MNEAAKSVSNEDRNYESHHVYGKNASLCVNFSETKGGIPTITLEGAKSTAPRVYDWEKKVAVQCTGSELPQVAAVFLGILPLCEFKNHGPEKNKWFRVENQGAHFFVNVGQSADARAIQVSLPDAVVISAFFLRRVAKMLKLDEATALQVLGRTFGAHKKA